MQRLIEQPSDTGELLEGPVSLGRVHYHLSVYQHFSDKEGEAVPSHVEVEGRVAPVAHVDLIALHRRSSDLRLHLSDGRTLECATSDHEGQIHSTGRGLYRE